MKKFVLILLLTQVLISCHVSTQNITIKNINCDGIDLATLGESARRVKLNLFEKYEIIEYTEDSAFSINLKNDEFISILYYNDSIKEIGVFCKNYNIGNEIYIGMKLAELQILIPNFEILNNLHDNYEYIEYSCDNNLIKFLVESKENRDRMVGNYTQSSERSKGFEKNAIITGFIITNKR